ncbi:PREDICTED: uncharacterized protein LOC108762206 [Trachymyrmex cornetzi]|uniref:uncharacterized protein LOC108762206 n=1 Tax=Trachymyrmex cornetzi TaxID=471704 RepID=UPI00084F5C2D|nr:PREDICTED: uncharacterized protein LOC108762206 [Trachymyrmex cornetzi]
MADNKIEVPILYGEKEELYTLKVSPDEYNRIMNGDENILKKLVAEETEKRSAIIIQQFANSNYSNENLESLEIVKAFEGDDTDNKENQKEVDDAKETFTWPEKAVMLFLELFRERE